MRFTSRARSASPSFAGLLFFTVFWCVLTGVFVGIVIYSVVRHLDAQRRFAETTGVVLSSTVREHPGNSDGGPTYEPVIHYRYTVNGYTFESRRLAFAKGSCGSYRAVAKIIAGFPMGKTIPVFYDPEKPFEAVLHLAIPSEMLFIALFLQPFILIGLGCIGFTAAFPLRKRRMSVFLEQDSPQTGPPWIIPTWGLLAPDYSNVLTIQGKTPPLLSLATGFAIGYGGTCFLSIFIVGIFFNGFSEPQPGVVATAWLIAFFLGVGVAVKLLLFDEPKARLCLDTRSGQVRIERQRETFHTAFKEIEAWRLREIPNPRRIRSVSDSQMAPLLYIQTRAGAELPVHVFEANPKAILIARKTGELLAGITGTVFQNPLPADHPVSTFNPSNGKEAFQLALVAAKGTTQHRDLI